MEPIHESNFDAIWKEHRNLICFMILRLGYEVDEDTEQVARIALLQAIRQYDPSRDTKLSTLLYLKLGSLLRDMHIRMTVPISVGYRDIRDKGELERIRQLKARVSVDCESVADRYEYSAAERGDWVLVEDATSAPDAEFVEIEYRIVVDQLWQAIRQVLHNDRAYTMLRLYASGMTTAEIGKVMGVSYSRVYQVVQDSMSFCRERAVPGTELYDLLRAATDLIYQRHSMRYD